MQIRFRKLRAARDVIYGLSKNGICRLHFASRFPALSLSSLSLPLSLPLQVMSPLSNYSPTHLCLCTVYGFVIVSQISPKLPASSTGNLAVTTEMRISRWEFVLSYRMKDDRFQTASRPRDAA